VSTLTASQPSDARFSNLDVNGVETAASRRANLDVNGVDHKFPSSLLQVVDHICCLQIVLMTNPFRH
jgi:hypothetical protein